MAASRKAAKTKAASSAPTAPQTSMLDQITDASKELFSPKKVARPDKNNAAVKSKQERKRAADFLSDEDGGAALPVPSVTQTTEIEAPPKKKSKKNTRANPDRDEVKDVPGDALPKAQPAPVSGEKAMPRKKAKKASSSLTADGINGVREHPNTENTEIITPKQTKKSLSMQAEAQRTTEKELQDDFGSGDEPEELGGALLAGFDSDGEDIAEDKDFDSGRPLPELQLSNKKKKKLHKALTESKSDGPGTVYVGRIPHGFYEHEMREYFSQFGPISKLRLSRNRITGASKHFAFIEFESNEVAKIVAEAMDNYLMFGHILKCKYAPPESLHADLWKGANKRFKKVPHNKLEKRQLAAPKAKEQWDAKIDREQKKREEKAKKMEQIGYDLKLPQMRTTDEVLASKKVANAEHVKAVEDEPTVGDDAAVIKPASSAKDDTALAKPQKPKKAKKDKHAVEGTAAPVTVEQPTTAQAPKQKLTKVEGIRNQKEDQNVTQTSQKPETIGKAGKAAMKSARIDNVKSEKKHKQQEQIEVDKQLDTQLNVTLEEAKAEAQALENDAAEKVDISKDYGDTSRRHGAKKNKKQGSQLPQPEVASSVTSQPKLSKTENPGKSEKRHVELDDGSKAVVKKHEPSEQKSDKKKAAKLQNKV